MSVRISIIIPLYRASQWIEATLASVVEQTLPAASFEIIAIDDASPDDSATVARNFLAKHPHTSRVVHLEKNGGLLATRNAGWRMASGDWIQFLDQDDLLSPHKLATQAAVADRANGSVAVIYSSWQYLRLEGATWQPSGAINAPFVDDDPLLKIVEEFAFGNVGPTLIRRPFLEQVGGFELKPNLGEDIDLMLRLARAGGHFRSAPSEAAAFLYRQLPGSLSSAYFKNKVAMRNLLESFRAVEDYWRETNVGGLLTERQRLALARRYSRFAERYLEHDPPTYRLLEVWLGELGFEQPVSMPEDVSQKSS